MTRPHQTQGHRHEGGGADRNLSDPPGGGAGSRAIIKADFDALVVDLVTELDAAGVTAADKAAILGALGPLCGQIVAGGTDCN